MRRYPEPIGRDRVGERKGGRRESEGLACVKATHQREKKTGHSIEPEETGIGRRINEEKTGERDRERETKRQRE